MASGEFTPIADKLTLDQVRELLGQASPTVADLATVMNGLKLLNDKPGGAMPGVVYNPSNFGKWEKTLVVVDDAGMRLATDGLLDAKDVSSRPYNNSSNTQAERYYGVKVTTGPTAVRLNRVQLSFNTTVNFMVTKTSDGTVLYNGPLPANTASPAWSDISSAGVILQPNTAYFLDVYSSYSDYSFGVATSAHGFPNTGVTFNGAYIHRSNLAPSLVPTAVYAVLGIEVQSYAQNVLSGSAVSPIITREVVAKWGKLSAVLDTPAGSSILFDILKASDNAVLLADLQTGADLSALPLHDVKVKAKLSRTNTGINPVLKSAMVDWSGADFVPVRRNVVGKLLVNTGSTSTYTTALSVTGKGQLLGLMMLQEVQNAVVRVSIDGQVVSWGGVPTGVYAFPVPEWAFFNNSAGSFLYQNAANGGSQANCKISFAQSLVIEMAALGRTINWAYEVE